MFLWGSVPHYITFARAADETTRALSGTLDVQLPLPAPGPASAAQWHRLNDAVRTPVTFEAVLASQQAAYALMYVATQPAAVAAMQHAAVFVPPPVQLMPQAPPPRKRARGPPT